MMEFIQNFLEQKPLFELWIVALTLVLSWYVAKALNRPVIIGYIIWWLILWPQVFDIIHHYENIEFYAHFWVSLLLFMVWLWLNPWLVKEVWKVAIFAWLWQILFTFIIGYITTLWLWFGQVESLFIAIALTFSSTIIIVKLISDRWDMWEKYWKISLWILLVQDIVAMIILLAISAIWLESDQWLRHKIIVDILPTVLLLLFWTRLISKYLLPTIIKKLDTTKELLLLFVIWWAMVSWGFRYLFWFSMEIWALLAWVALASSDAKKIIYKELRPFRDFFLALFFVYLWWQIIFDGISSILLPVLIYSLIVLIWNPLIIIYLMRKMWYKSQESFMTGLSVAQISEFAFIIVWLALETWILWNNRILTLVTIVWLITMTWSSYLFTHADAVHTTLQRLPIGNGNTASWKKI